jgi:hypothetical protein
MFPKTNDPFGHGKVCRESAHVLNTEDLLWHDCALGFAPFEIYSKVGEEPVSIPLRSVS